MSDTIVERKNALRKSMLLNRSALTFVERHAAARALAAHAPTIARMAGKRIVSGFTPFKDEIDTLPLLEALSQTGLTIAMPRVAGAHLTFHAWRPGDPLVAGRYGQPEPEAGTPEIRPGLMMTPLLAFDRRGCRLGYGGGFFDRVLADYRIPLTIGLAYAMQEVEVVPTEPHDQSLAWIATERELIDCRAQQGH